jgi:hypothetical protein
MPEKRVFRSVEEAKRNEPKDGKFRFRLYEVTCKSTGEKRYVWERNPQMAVGRGATELGVSALVYNEAYDALPPSEREWLHVMHSLTPAERERIVAAMRRAEEELRDAVDN